MPVRSAVRAPARAALALTCLFALAGCSSAPEGTPDAGGTTPDAGGTTPDAGGTTPDAGDTTPDAGPTPPETTITSGPEGTTTAFDAAFEFTSDTAGATFECVIDDGVFDACTSPQSFSDLPEGPHTFSVRAVVAERIDASPATRSWTVDTKPHVRRFVDRKGDVYIVDTGNCAIRKVTIADGKITTIAGKGGTCQRGDDNLPATETTLNYPLSLALAPDGDVYFAEDDNRIRKVDVQLGVVQTVVGGGTGPIADGASPTSGAVADVQAIATNAVGDLFFNEGNALRVFRVSTNAVTTLIKAPGGECTVAGDGVDAAVACFDNSITAIHATAAGDLLVGAGQRLFRLVNSTSKLEVVVGTGVYGSDGYDGPAKEARIQTPTGVVVDVDGNVLFAAPTLKTISKVTASTGVLSVFAGQLGQGGSDGIGGPATSAKLNQPGDLSFDLQGNLYILDSDNQQVRKVDPSGNLSVFAGSGVEGYSGDGGAATDAKLRYPGGFWWWWD